MSKLEFNPHQITLGKQATAIVNKLHMVYLAMEERTRKTGTAIYACNKLKAKTVIILTKVKAKPDWVKALKAFPVEFKWELSTYHSAHKVKLKRADIVILDEAHNYISAKPKPGKIYKQVRALVRGSEIIYLSATPHAQGYHQLFHQFKMCFAGPWENYRTYYDWYREYALLDSKGRTEKIFINGTHYETYERLQEKRIKTEIDKYFIRKTRKELGFKEEPKDVLHYIKLGENTKKAYNRLVKNRVLNFTLNGKSYEYVADTSSKLRTALHQLEGGTIIMTNEEGVNTALVLSERSKIDYILKSWGDTDDLVIMYHFKAELIKLRKVFKKATLAQASTMAEGVDYSHITTLVIYSQDYSTAKHSQRRARQASMDRDIPIDVHFLLVKKAVSSEVYKTVSINKKNYVDSVFKRKPI